MRRRWSDIADWCDRFTPLVALDPPYGLFLDITGCAHLFGGEAALLHDHRARSPVSGFVVSAAIAGTSVCARTLTRQASRHHRRRWRGGGSRQRRCRSPRLVPATPSPTGLRRAGLKTIGDVASRAAA